MIDYIDIIKSNTPDCTCKWDDKLLQGEIVYNAFKINYEVDCSALDFKNLDDFIEEIQNVKFDFNFDELGNFNENEKQKLIDALYQYIPYFSELAKKELEV